MGTDVWIGLDALWSYNGMGSWDGYLHRGVALAFGFCIGRLDGLALGMACITCAQDLPCLNSLVGWAFVYFDFVFS